MPWRSLEGIGVTEPVRGQGQGAAPVVGIGQLGQQNEGVVECHRQPGRVGVGTFRHAQPGAVFALRMEAFHQHGEVGIDITWLLSGQSAATTTSLLKREIGALVEDYQRADANGKAFLVYTASFLVEGTEKQDPRSPSKK